MAVSPPIRLGISQCLLGDHVRYDGGHKRDRFLTDVLGRYVEWVPICPEVESGFGTPREPMRLVGASNVPRLVTITTQRDLTKQLKGFSTRKIGELQTLDLSGYVFKARSPSCGIESVPLYGKTGKAKPDGRGLFARAFQKQFPLIPITDEGRLADPASREHFLKRVFGYHRWSQFTKGPVTRRAIVSFHQAQADLLSSCSRRDRQALNQLVATPARYRPTQLAARYGRRFMKTLQSSTEPREISSTSRRWRKE
ncbi:MAG: DUF523 and DUF1722 domain-containing protein [Nitrospirota bacterium]